MPRFHRHEPASSLPSGNIHATRGPKPALVIAATLLGLATIAAIAAITGPRLGLTPGYPLVVGGFFAIVMTIVVASLHERHPFAHLGPANYVTASRAMLVALLAGLVGQPSSREAAASAAAAALVVLALDGVDGWLARRTGMASAFGARFDMEVDALLIMVLATLAWQYDKAGVWVLASGLLRYGFVAAGWLLPRLRYPLPHSRRRQAVCVVQVAALIVVLLPPLTRPASAALAAIALAVLMASFLVDTRWLLNRGVGERRTAAAANGVSNPRPFWNWVVLAAALVLLNAVLTFQNIWPTPAIEFRPHVSPELAFCVLALTIVSRFAAPSVLRGLAVVWVFLIIGRYANVTAPALYGRDINVFWDVRHLSSVVNMMVRAASPWVTALVIAVAVLVPTSLYLMCRWAFGRLASASRTPRERRALVVLAASMTVAFAGQRLLEGFPASPTFSTMVTPAYGRQLQLMANSLSLATGARSLGTSPSLANDLKFVRGADVFLLFVESYGAISFERSEFNKALAQVRKTFEAAIHETNRHIVSAYVQSPTFGGFSWLAHVTLMTGVEVRDEDTNQVLMMQERDTMVSAFARQGYRTVAWMPGLTQRWPEGAFYGFDEIYGAPRLAYHGPEFGWWAIPDQFAIARLDDVEVSRANRKPLFVFFPTISTHAPFKPLAPYQPDWTRVLSDRPFDENDLERIFADEPDWLNLGPDYVRALSYAYTSLEAYLRRRAERDFVLIILGDHQPMAAVSGENVSWDVPVHIITSRRPLVDRLQHQGFRAGLEPARPAIGSMHGLLPTLIDAFGERQTLVRR
jgi:phosphatidylglycerophosphate synthase